MKTIFLFALLNSAFASAQSVDSCQKTTFLFSREIFPESISIQRTIALVDASEKCQEESILLAKPVQTANIERDRYQYWKEFHSRQTPDGFERLSVSTEQLIDRVHYRKP